MNKPKVEIALFWTDEGVPCVAQTYDDKVFIHPLGGVGGDAKATAWDFCKEAQDDAVEDRMSYKAAYSFDELCRRLTEAGAVGLVRLESEAVWREESNLSGLIMAAYNQGRDDALRAEQDAPKSR